MSQLSLLLKLTHSRMKAQEFLFLIKGVKPVIRQAYYDDEIGVIGALCNELGLHLRKSNFKVAVDKGDSVNKGIKSNDGMAFYYISNAPELADQARTAEEEENHLELGKLLGYPPCCINYFQNNFSEQNTNPMLTPTNWETNLTKRIEDWCILSHFPCANDCDESLKIAKTYFMQIELDDADWAKELKTQLEVAHHNG